MWLAWSATSAPLRREDLGRAHLDGSISIIWPIVGNAPLERCLMMTKETGS